MRKISKPTDAEIRQLIHTPANVAQSFVSWATDRRNKVQSGKGVRFPGVLDREWTTTDPNGNELVLRNTIPGLGGDLIIILARPSMGKTLFLQHMAKQEALRIARDPSRAGECVIYVPYEGSVEIIDAAFQSSEATFNVNDVVWGRANLDDLKATAIKRARLPVYYVGRSFRQRGQNITPMYIENVYRAIEMLNRDLGVRPTMVAIDYIQLMPDQQTRERISQVESAIVSAKELAESEQIPVFVAAQAGRQVDARREKIPEAGDFQWSSQGEQAADKMFSLWIPNRSYAAEDEWEEIMLDGVAYDNTPNLMVIRKLKERHNKGFGVWPLHMNLDRYYLSDYAKPPAYP